MKNAFSLLGKQRFQHSAAFFLLAGSLKDAVEVIVCIAGNILYNITNFEECNLPLLESKQKLFYLVKVKKHAYVRFHKSKLVHLFYLHFSKNAFYLV